MKESVMSVKNGMFLACVFNHDSIDVDAAEKLLVKLEQYCENDWFELGYKYIGPIRKAGIDPKSRWVEKLLCCLRDKHNGVSQDVENGVQRFFEDTDEFALDFKAFAAAVEHYLSNELSHYDRQLLGELECPDAQGEYFPITEHEKWRIGIVNPWPGGMSAEAEVLARTKVAADDAGAELVMLSNFGHRLDSDTQEQCDDFVDHEELDFVISTHYDTHKCLDSFYYHTLWNPPEIPLNLEDYPGRVTDNYVMNDDFLIYDDGGMEKHLRCILMNSERNLKAVSTLTASFPEKCLLPPKLSDPKMFYCGMNWERVVHNSNRHEGLFRLLDNTGKIKFFGPDKVAAWGGIRPWEGYKCYQYSIPFDGFSILKEINDCGICLVLSSDTHRRAGAATNRTYEACAAGAVIISDDNPFMLKHFKDAALFIKYNKNDPRDTFTQLMEKYQWIIEHKDEAIELARRAQAIFREKFALDYQIKQIIKNHPQRLRAAKEALYAKNEDAKVLVTFVLNTTKLDCAKKLLEQVILNIKNQYYRNIQLAVAVDAGIKDDVATFCKKQLYSVHVVGMELFDFKGARFMTDCEAIDRLCEIPHQYFINTKAEERWFKDHITTLVRTLQDTGAVAAYSGRLFEDKYGYRRTDMFRKLTASTIYNMNCPDWMPVPGQILCVAEGRKAIPSYMSPYLDGMEHYALLNLQMFRHQEKLAFSHRMTFNYVDGRFDERNAVVPEAMQIRLIRDSVKDYIPSGSMFVNSISSEGIMRIIADVPVKKLFRVRWQRIVLRILPSRWKLTKTLSEKYTKNMESLTRHFL